jgi:hypothetical protein
VTFSALITTVVQIIIYFSLDILHIDKQVLEHFQLRSFTMWRDKWECAYTLVYHSVKYACNHSNVDYEYQQKMFFNFSSETFASQSCVHQILLIRMSCGKINLSVDGRGPGICVEKIQHFLKLRVLWLTNLCTTIHVLGDEIWIRSATVNSARDHARFNLPSHWSLSLLKSPDRIQFDQPIHWTPSRQRALRPCLKAVTLKSYRLS